MQITVLFGCHWKYVRISSLLSASPTKRCCQFTRLVMKTLDKEKPLLTRSKLQSQYCHPSVFGILQMCFVTELLRMLRKTLFTVD